MADLTRDEAIAADPLIAIAARLCDFVNTNFNPRAPLLADQITLRHIGELCWVLDLTPDYNLVPRQEAPSHD